MYWNGKKGYRPSGHAGWIVTLDVLKYQGKRASLWQVDVE